MKIMAIGSALTAMGLGFAVVGGTDADLGRTGPEYPPGCAVTVAVAPGFLPRADLTVENRLARPIQVRLEGRAGSGLAAVDFGTIGPQQRAVFAHALPAGRNALTAEDGAGAPRRQLFFVNNHGADTCLRRFLMRIE